MTTIATLCAILARGEREMISHTRSNPLSAGIGHRFCKSTLILCLFFAPGPTVQADTVFGIVSTVDIASGNFLSDFPNQIVNFSNGGNPVPVTSYNSPILSDSGSYTFGNSTIAGTATAWGSVSNTGLHGFASAGISGPCETCPFATENGAGFDVNWFDGITVTGLPNGTPVDLLLTVALNSAIGGPANEASISSFAELNSQEVSVSNDNGLSTASILVHTFSGATLQLTSSIEGMVSVNDSMGPESAMADASDTGNTYITVLTPGAGYTTLSGLNYTASTPEPSALYFTIISFLALLYAAKIRRKHVQQPVNLALRTEE